MIRAIEIDIDPETIAATVTAQSHPRLAEALETIAHDSGAGAGRTSYGIPPEWVDRLPEIEAALATLSAGEMEDFCIGEEGEQQAIAARSAGLTAAGALLEAFFHGWQQP